MEWRDVADTVGNVAPALGASLGGPGGRAIGGLIASALGVANDPQAVKAALREDPKAAMELRRIEADLEQTLIQGRAETAKAEIQGESWLQRSWRPLAMLTFTVLVAAHWLGFTAENLTQSSIDGILDIVRLGMAGYIAGRSIEKTAKIASGTGIFEHLKGKAKK